MFTINELLDIAVRIEKNGETAYRQAAQKAARGNLQDVLEGLADQEAEHRRWFADLKKRLDLDEKNPLAQQIAREIFDDILGRWTFSLDEKNLPQFQTPAELYDVSIVFEKDTVIFYEMLAGFIDDESTLTQLQAIINEEKRHITKLESLKSSTISTSDVSGP